MSKCLRGWTSVWQERLVYLYEKKDKRRDSISMWEEVESRKRDRGVVRGPRSRKVVSKIQSKNLRKVKK